MSGDETVQVGRGSGRCARSARSEPRSLTKQARISNKFGGNGRELRRIAACVGTARGSAHGGEAELLFCWTPVPRALAEVRTTLSPMTRHVRNMVSAQFPIGTPAGMSRSSATTMCGLLNCRAGCGASARGSSSVRRRCLLKRGPLWCVPDQLERGTRGLLLTCHNSASARSGATRGARVRCRYSSTDMIRCASRSHRMYFSAPSTSCKCKRVTGENRCSYSLWHSARW